MVERGHDPPGGSVAPFSQGPSGASMISDLRSDSGAWPQDEHEEGTRVRSTIRIMIVEDHELLREGLALMVGRAPDLEVVALASSGEEALERWDEARPDLVLLDLRLPGMSGTELCTRLKERKPSIQVVILSAHEELTVILEAVQAGACAYIPKDISARDLVENLRRVRDEGSLLEPFLAKRLLSELTRRPSPGGPAIQRAAPDSGPALSAREMEILRQVVAGASNKEIAAGLSISNFTVANHLKNIYRKLGVKDRTQAVLAAMNRGLLAMAAATLLVQPLS